MTFVLITFTASLVLNLVVLALLKIGLENNGSAGEFSGRLPC